MKKPILQKTISLNKSFFVLSLLCMFLFAGYNMHAQRLDPSADPISGTVRLSEGFTPDPHTLRATSGGSIDVSQLGLCSGCRGFASRSPDIKFHWSGNSSSLKVFFEADDSNKDATLVINTPDGSWIGNDDAYSGTNNPMLGLSGYGSGRYDIWVGSYSSGEYISGTLTITELERSPRGTSGSSGSSGSSSSSSLCTTCDPISATIRLSENFTPDPHATRVTSGGSIDVSQLGLCSGCSGHASRSPDLKLHWSGSSADLRVFFEADDNRDATLIINTPDGTWIGNDDAFSGTRNPMLLLSGYGPGRYDIWVGSYSSGEYISGSFTVTELSRQPR